MIRRRLHHPALGPCFALITQDDHAKLAAQLAAHLGTSRYPRPEPFDPFLLATALHDAGWPAHDDAPTLSKDGLPSDVFETTRETAIRVWPGAPEAAARAEAALATPSPRPGWAELLVSIHVLSLSAYASEPTGFNHEKIDTSTMEGRFDLNKFQHREMERQERLRRALGLSTDIPLTLGLADEDDANSLPPTPRHLEADLRSHVRWLQAMDVCSLALCCTTPPMPHTQDTHPTPTSPGEPLRLRRDANDLIVTPWPFAIEHIPVTIPTKLVPARPYTSPQDLHQTLATAPPHPLQVTVRPH